MIETKIIISWIIIALICFSGGFIAGTTFENVDIISKTQHALEKQCNDYIDTNCNCGIPGVEIEKFKYFNSVIID
jgi:hypothetical protein